MDDYDQPTFTPGMIDQSTAPNPPGVAIVVAITVLFGIFGIIPAAMRSDRARREGYSTGRYWTAFAVTLVIMIGLYAILFSASA